MLTGCGGLGDESGAPSENDASGDGAPESGAPATGTSVAFDGSYKMVAKSITEFDVDGGACGDASGAINIVGSSPDRMGGKGESPRSGSVLDRRHARQKSLSKRRLGPL